MRNKTVGRNAQSGKGTAWCITHSSRDGDQITTETHMTNEAAKTDTRAALAGRVERRVIRDGETTIDLASIGLGRMRTSATYAALLIQLEGERSSQIDVLDSVMEALGIHPEEIIHNRKMPECGDEEERRRWAEEADELRRKLSV
jgi:hypothetical protein